MECNELLKENEKLKKENEELRHAITGAVERNEELWDALNRASAKMRTFVLFMEHDAGDTSLESRNLTKWTNNFDICSKKLTELMLHSEYRRLHKCGDKRYWFK
jgi:cell division septum initiation protein DivIVA